MLKKMIVVAMTLIALTGIASAGPSLPPSMHGLWCHAGGQVAKDTIRYVRGKCDKELSDDYLVIGVGTIEGHEWGCRIRKVVLVGRTYKVSGKCSGEGTRSDQEMSVWLDGRFIFYRLDRSSNELPDLETLTCRDHRSDPSDDDLDPVVITLLTFADTFRVAHTTRSGKTYVRGDQYRDVQSSIRGDDVISWSGTWKRDPKKRMVGTLTHDNENYRYTERIYDGNRLETTITSTCTR